ncbi:DUF1684 domain-containing protein [Cyclobacteriaceae bacterium]|nr:DUF1684 domain-containing protein [Cyclobacteriaceae bacterium]
MKIFVLTVTLVLQVSFVFSQDKYTTEMQTYQQELNAKFKDAKTSPLEGKELKKFKGLPFFQTDSTFKILAKFTLVDSVETVQFNTTTDRKPLYDIYGILTFEIDSVQYRLFVYQSHSLREREEYKDYLFLPFGDLTNGELTYGGGRFIDMRIPIGDSVLLDFNKAYNPYCAYSQRYSCPIVPQENFLKLEIRAGVKYKK